MNFYKVLCLANKLFRNIAQMQLRMVYFNKITKNQVLVGLCFLLSPPFQGYTSSAIHCSYEDIPSIKL